jgi:transposase
MLSLVVLGGAWPGMVTVETIGRIRRAFWVDKKPIRQIVRELKISRQTVRKAIRGSTTEFRYERQVQPQPRLGAHVARLDAMLEANSKRPARERLTARRLFELLRSEGYDGAYDSVQRHVREWRRQHSQQGPVFIPLWFAPGEAYQFDWSHEVVVLGGVTTTVKVAHIRLCHSRMFLVRAYPRETQEMVFDAHERAFRLFGGACRRGIYDNMSTAVEAVFVGKERRFNRRFLAMCSHYLVDPTACTPAAGWEKGPGREPGWQCARAPVHTAAALCQLCRAQRLAGSALPRSGARERAPRANRQDGVGSVRGRAGELDRLPRTV